MEQIEIGGIKYLASINFKVILDLQKAGISLTDFERSEDQLTDSLKIVYFAIADGHAAQNKVFELDYDNFVRQIMPKDFKGIMEFISQSKFLQGVKDMGIKKKVKEAAPSP